MQATCVKASTSMTHYDLVRALYIPTTAYICRDGSFFHVTERLTLAHQLEFNQSVTRTKHHGLMLSPKDYILEITPAIDVVDDHNMLQFTIRHRNLGVLDDHKLAICAITVTVVVTFILEILGWIELKQLEVGSWIRAAAVLVASAGVLVVAFKQEPLDSIMVMKDIGLQLELKLPWRFQSPIRHFVPLDQIIDLVLHEGFHNYGQVIFYLVILTKPSGGSSDIIRVVFPKFLPRKDVLLKVRSLSRDLLFGKKLYWRRVPGKGLQQIVDN